MARQLGQNILTIPRSGRCTSIAPSCLSSPSILSWNSSIAPLKMSCAISTCLRVGWDGDWDFLGLGSGLGDRTNSGTFMVGSLTNSTSTGTGPSRAASKASRFGSRLRGSGTNASFFLLQHLAILIHASTVKYKAIEAVNANIAKKANVNGS